MRVRTPKTFMCGEKAKTSLKIADYVKRTEFESFATEILRDVKYIKRVVTGKHYNNGNASKEEENEEELGFPEFPMKTLNDVEVCNNLLETSEAARKFYVSLYSELSRKNYLQI